MALKENGFAFQTTFIVYSLNKLNRDLTWRGEIQPFRWRVSPFLIMTERQYSFSLPSFSNVALKSDEQDGGKN